MRNRNFLSFAQPNIHYPVHMACHHSLCYCRYLQVMSQDLKLKIHINTIVPPTHFSSKLPSFQETRLFVCVLNSYTICATVSSHLVLDTTNILFTPSLLWLMVPRILEKKLLYLEPCLRLRSRPSLRANIASRIFFPSHFSSHGCRPTIGCRGE